MNGRVAMAALAVALLRPAFAGAEGNTCGNETVIVPDGRITRSIIFNGTTFFFAAYTTVGRSYSAEFANALGATVPPGDLTIYSDVGCSSTVTGRDTTMLEPPTDGGARRVSFTATTTKTIFRLANSTGADSEYTFNVSETTLYSPAWTTNGTYDTYYAFQNTTTALINGTLTLLDMNGATVQTLAISNIPAGGIFGTNTVSLGVTRNRVGNARFTHDGPPGAVQIKADQANFAVSPPFIQIVPFLARRETR
jgi:hypothetical protein